MTSSVTLSAATRQNLLSLQDTANLLSTTQNRLSTGKKVNSALDNPTNYFTSQSLSSRSSDLSALLDGMSNGVQVVQAANQGITSIQKLLDTAKSTAQQALADKSGSAGTIIGGVAAQAASVTGTSTVGATYDMSTLGKDASLDISLDGGVTKNTIRLDASTLKNVTSNTGSVTSDQLVTAINGQIAASPNLAGKVTASIGTNGRLIFATTDTGANAKLAVNGSANAQIDIGFGASSTTTTAATITAGAALDTTTGTDFSGGKTAQFTISDGTKSVTVSLNKDTATDNLGGVLTTQAAGPPATATATAANVIKAINKQLSDNGSSITASLSGGTTGSIVFTSTDKGPDAQLSITGVSDNTTAGTGATAAGTGLGFKTFTASGGVKTAGTASSAAAAAANSTVPANLDLSGGKSANLAVTGISGSAVSIKIDAQTTASGTALGNSPTQAQVAQAITDQLTAAGANFTAAFTGNKLTFTASANGVGNITVAATNDTIGLGFGTTGTTTGAFSAGTGTPAAAIAAVGTDASDGSSKATVTGTSPPTAAPGNFTTATKTFDFSANQNASFSLQLGTGPVKQISLTGAQFAGSNSVTEASLAKAINDQITADTGLSGQVKATFVNDKLTIQTTNFGSSQALSISAGGTTDIGFGVTGAAAVKGAGTDIGGAKGNSSTRSTLAAQFNQILQQISQQAQDSSYNGVNLLYRNSDNASDNSLHITFNEKNTSALDITGVRFDATGLGLANVTGNFQSDADVNTAINQLTAATSTLRTQSSTFGANLSVVQNRQDFTKQLNTILDTGSSNLTSADLNEEAANSQALSTRNSLAISALSLANQAQQGILQLLR